MKKNLPVSGDIKISILMSPETGNLEVKHELITRFGWHEKRHSNATRNG